MENIYSEIIPEVVIKRTKKELNLVNHINYKIIEKRFFDYMISASVEYTEMLDKESDILWHNFLLDTKGYREFCYKNFNRFIDHYPYENEKKLTIEEIELTAKKIVKNVSEYRRKFKMNKMDIGPYMKENTFFNYIRKEVSK